MCPMQFYILVMPNAETSADTTKARNIDLVAEQYHHTVLLDNLSIFTCKIRPGIEGGSDSDHNVQQVCFLFHTSRLFWLGDVVFFRHPTAIVKDNRRPGTLPESPYPIQNSLIYHTS